LIDTESGTAGHGKTTPLYRDRNLLVIYTVTLMAVLGTSSITPAFPTIVRELRISSREVGLLITVFTFPGIILTPIFGVLADRAGRKRILVPSLVLFSVAGSLCFFARDFTSLLELRFLQGVGAASLGSLNVTLIGDLFEGRSRTAAMGYNSSVLSIGTGSFPAIGGLLASVAWYYPFLLPIAALPVSLIVLFFLNNPEPSAREPIRGYLKRAWSSVLDRRVIVLFIGSVTTFVIIFGAYLTCLPLLLGDSFGAHPTVIGLILSTTSISTAVSASQLGRLHRFVSGRMILVSSYLLYAAALVMIPSVGTLWHMLLPAVLAGVAVGTAVPVILTLLSDYAPLEHRGAFMSINGMVLRLGQTIGPVLLGTLYGTCRAKCAFYPAAALAVLLVILFALLVDE
jgi:ACDE family multidrug resistance protein